MVGGWTGSLANSAETITLETAQGENVNSVRYASEGDWAVRTRGNGAVDVTSITRSGTNAQLHLVDERLVGKRHRYGYAPGFGNESNGTDRLHKHDFVGNGSATRSFGAGKQLGEFVFHPSSTGAAEDDGVLMGFVYDAATDRSALAILDAQTLDDVATVHLPHRVPAGFHGNWVPTGL